jgi:hypothetical protein
MISLRIAVGLLLLGAMIAMLGAAWIDMNVEQRLAAAGVLFIGILFLLGMDPISRAGRDK